MTNIIKRIFKIKNAYNTIIIIMFGTFVSKVLGLLRDTVLAGQFGASLTSDAYIISTTIPSLLIGMVATAVLYTYIPIINEIEKEKKDSINNFSNNLINITTIFTTILIAIYYLFSKQIVSIFVLGFNAKELNYVVKMTNITIFASYFLILISIYSGYLQNKEKFKATSFYGIIFNLVSILGIILAYKYNSILMAYFFVFGYGLSAIFLAIIARKAGLVWKKTINFRDKFLKKLGYATIPILISSVVWDINVIIDKTLISTIGPGYVSGLNYSSKLANVSLAIISSSIAIYIFPKISKYFQNLDKNSFNKIITNAICLILIILIPITFFLVSFSEEIIQIFFGRGNFDAFAFSITNQSLKLYSFTLIFSGVNTIIYKAFNAMLKNKIPTMNAIKCVTINIIFSLILIGPYGYKGVILGSIISNAMATTLIIIKLVKEKIFINYFQIFLVFLKSSFASLIVTIFVKILFTKFCNFENVFINDILIGIIFVLLYAISMYIIGFNKKYYIL